MAGLTGLGAAVHAQSPTLRPGEAAAGAAISQLLAEAGYVGVPIHQDESSGYVVVEVRLDTTSIALVLDTGGGIELLLTADVAGAAGSDVRTLAAQQRINSVFGANDVPLLEVGRADVGKVGLRSLEGMAISLPQIDGLLGSPLLRSRGAIVDYVTDTLYLLKAPDAPVEAHAAAPPYPTVRAALEAEGRYRTFLALMQRAGLISLLEKGADPAELSDSLIWLESRIGALHATGTDTLPPDSARTQLIKAGLDRLFRRAGQLTAFVPTDAAFARLGPDTLRALGADQARLVRLLRAHLALGVVLDTAAFRTLVRGFGRSTGPAFGVYQMGQRLDVDRVTAWDVGRVVGRATIVQPDLRAANGIVHGIDRVLESEPAPTPLAAALARQGYVAIPMYRHPYSIYSVHAQVDGVAVTLLVDTGAPAGEVVIDASRPDPLQLEGSSLVLDSVSFGSVEVTSSDFSAQRQSLREKGYLEADGLLGGRFLARFGARMDLANGILYLRRPTADAAARPTPP